MTREARLGAFIVALRGRDPIAAIQAEADVQEILASLAEARRDTERVDAWEQMKRGPFATGAVYHLADGFTCCWHWSGRAYETWREAMDAAHEKGGARWLGECPRCGRMVTRVSVSDKAVTDDATACPVMCDDCHAEYENGGAA